MVQDITALAPNHIVALLQASREADFSVEHALALAERVLLHARTIGLRSADEVAEAHYRDGRRRSPSPALHVAEHREVDVGVRPGTPARRRAEQEGDLTLPLRGGKTRGVVYWPLGEGGAGVVFASPRGGRPPPPWRAPARAPTNSRA